MFRKRDPQTELRVDIEMLNARIELLTSAATAHERRIQHLEQFQHGHCVRCGWPTDSVTITECPPPVCKGRKAA